MRSSLIFLLIILALSSCFRRFRMTESDLDRYYAQRQDRPISQVAEISKDKKLHWVQTGPDTLPLLIFIHGAPGAWYGYLNLLSDSSLQSRFAMISVDRPGYNQSKWRGKLLEIEGQGEAISILLKQNKHRPIFLLGRSYGAPIAAYLAAKYPDLVKGLILVSPAASPDLEKFWWFSPLVQYPPLRWLFPAPIRLASSEKYAHRKELKKLIPSWAEINCPTHIVHGGKDFIVSPKNLCFVDSLMTHPLRKTWYLPQHGHLITRENPSLIRAMLLSLERGDLL